MDPVQLKHFHRTPTLLSAHILTSFEYLLLKEYVRSSDDEFLQELQELTRKINYSKEDLERFRTLIETKCTFVDSINDERVKPHMLRIFSKKEAIKEYEEIFLNQIKNSNNEENFIAVTADDSQCLVNGNWMKATKSITNKLNKATKEPENLHFFQTHIMKLHSTLICFLKVNLQY